MSTTVCKFSKQSNNRATSKGR